MIEDELNEIYTSNKKITLEEYKRLLLELRMSAGDKYFGAKSSDDTEWYQGQAWAYHHALALSEYIDDRPQDQTAERLHTADGGFAIHGYDTERDLRHAKADCERLLDLLSMMKLSDVLKTLEPYRERNAEPMNYEITRKATAKKILKRLKTTNPKNLQAALEKLRVEFGVTLD